MSFTMALVMYEQEMTNLTNYLDLKKAVSVGLHLFTITRREH